MAWSRPRVLVRNAISMRPPMARPIQKAEKLPATRPERMVRPVPPSLVASTISRQWALLVLVKRRVSSGMIAAAMVPQEMMVASFHQREGSAGKTGAASCR